VGLTVMIFSWRASSASSRRGPSGARAEGTTTADGFRALSSAAQESASTPPKLELAPEMTPRGKLIGLLIANVIWNSIVGAMVWHALGEHAAGQLEVGFVIFVAIFAVIGLALLAGIPYQVLALANPRPSLRLEPEGKIVLGQPCRLRWQIEGGAGKLVKLRLTLIGEEVATYRRGTSTSTARHVFERRVLVETVVPQQIEFGEATIELPIETVPSFEASNNKIVWKLELAGEIPKRPDLLDTYPLTVVCARRVLV
jgi:hypothetical protein